jgi:hypothetical protein
MNDYQCAREDASRALKFAAASASVEASETAALRGIGYAILALAATIYEANEKVEITGPGHRVAAPRSSPPQGGASKA